MKKFLILILMLPSLCCIAQEQIIPEKKAFTDSENKYFQQAELPVYFMVSHTPDGKGTLLKEDRDTEVKPIYLDGHGVHLIKHSDDFHKRQDVFRIYADGNAPVSTFEPSCATTYKSKDIQYYGKGFTANVSAKEDMSGLDKIYVSLNGEVYKEFNNKFNLDKTGEYTVQYYATDKVGNTEKPKKVSFTVDVDAPKTFHNFIGIASGKIISTTSHIYLSKEDEKSGVAATWYSFDSESPKRYNEKEIPFAYLENGDHTLYYWSVDNVGNEEPKQSVEFFLDKVAPVASIDILGDKFVVDNKIYLSGRTKVKITAIDNRSGIKELKYSINNSLFQDYAEPFYMPSKAGMYTIQYFATDESGNRNNGEELHSKGVIYVDLLGPELSCKIDGPLFKKKNGTYLGPDSKFNFSGKDGESGLKNLAYSVNGGEEKSYTEPFVLGVVSGKYDITYIGYDNVNNRNEKSITLFLDIDKPEIEVKFSTDSEMESKGNESYYPSYTMVYLSSTDRLTTSSDISYSINDGKEQVYVSPIKGFEPDKSYKIKVTAKDAVGNIESKLIEFKTTDF